MLLNDKIISNHTDAHNVFEKEKMDESLMMFVQENFGFLTAFYRN